MVVTDRGAIAETHKMEQSPIITVLSVLAADNQAISSLIAQTVNNSNNPPFPPHSPSDLGTNHHECSSVMAASSQDIAFQTVPIRAREYTSHRGCRIRSMPALSAGRKVISHLPAPTKINRRVITTTKIVLIQTLLLPSAIPVSSRDTTPVAVPTEVSKTTSLLRKRKRRRKAVLSAG